MTCAFCQKEFRFVDGEKTCRSCSLFGGCQKVKCPYCHYEMPQEISFGNKIQTWRGFLGRILSR